MIIVIEYVPGIILESYRYVGSYAELQNKILHRILYRGEILFIEYYSSDYLKVFSGYDILPNKRWKSIGINESYCKEHELLSKNWVLHRAF